MSLRFRYALLLAALVAGVAVVHGALFLVKFRQAWGELGEIHARLWEARLLEGAAGAAEGVSRQLAESLLDPLYFYDLATVEEILEIALAHPDLEAVAVYDVRGRPLATRGATAPELSPGTRAALARGAVEVRRGDGAVEVFTPLRLAGQPLGTLWLRHGLRRVVADIQATGAVLAREQARLAAELVGGLALITVVLVAVGILLSLRLASFIERPVAELRRFAAELGRGGAPPPLDTRRRDEFGEVARALEAMAAALEERGRELRALAFQDALTGIPNRAFFRRAVEQAIKRARRRGEALALLFVDLDDFKAINDLHGHETGDQVLVEVARRLRESLREVDLVGRGVELGRLAGDEFTVLLEGLRDARAALAVAERILERLGEPFAVGDRRLNLKASVGVALYPQHGADADSLLRSADAAMYRVKAGGKGGAALFDEHLGRALERDLALARELGGAWRRGEFELWFQPQVELASGRTVAVEALLRWRHPRLGLLSPEHFLAALERDPDVLATFAWAVGEAAARLAALGAAEIRLALNLSARELAQPERLLPVLAAAAERLGGPHRIALECAEAAALTVPDASLALARLERAGYGVWLDDFGAGAAALGPLLHWPLTGVKLSRVVVGRLPEPSAHALLEAAAVAAGARGLALAAVGVEGEEQERTLRALGCDLAQGHRYGPPCPAEALPALLGATPPPPAV
ncbi:MAG: GGDEF domain-containing protein [Porticoccaceae bacterium]|nr:MAG: GGDEF domain-containing protein [Porticoccaceae bacterium]